MYLTVSPIGTPISIPENVEENEHTFSTDQLRLAASYYQENGYVVIRNAVSGEVCDNARAAFQKTVKNYKGYIYRQATASPEKNQINEFGFVMNPILNIQSLQGSKFDSLKTITTKIFTSDVVKQFCKDVFSEDPKLVQTMYFEGNSETWAHQDTYYMDSESLGTMMGCWYALEDIDAGAGRFFVIPGSHRIDMARNGDQFDIAFNHERYKDLVKKIIAEDRFEFRAPCLKKGDLLFWNSKTIHGSLKTTRPQYSRCSLTSHFIPSSHRYKMFQSFIRPLKTKDFNGILFHCPKDLDKLQNRAIMAIETTFPMAFKAVKKIAIKAVVR